MAHVLVVGAGITGLTAARALRARGLDVTVIEAAPQVGGVMQTARRDGFLAECGPNSCLLTPAIRTLVEDAGLQEAMVTAGPAAKNRYVVRDGIPIAMPMSPLGFLRTPLFSAAGKLRLLAEPFIGRRRAADDESIAGFVRRRLGAEFVDWAIDPFVSGVYAGDPARLSVRHAFPKLHALEVQHGSLMRGAAAMARARGRAQAQAAAAGSGQTMISFREGMATLPRTLAAGLGAQVHRHARLAGVQRTGHGVVAQVVRGGETAEISADAVVLTAPLHALPGVRIAAEIDVARQVLSGVPYPAVASVALGFRREDVAHPLDGFGLLVPSREGRSVLGVLFSSTLFPGRAPAGQVLLTCFMGGTRHPALAALDTDALLGRLLPDLTALLGVRGAPTFVHHTLWPRAIPQYVLGHDAVLAAAQTVEAAVPGLLLDGQFRRGVSVGDCVAGGTAIADRVQAWLAAPAPTSLAPPLVRPPAAATAYTAA